jgi:hypothetical protein
VYSLNKRRDTHGFNPTNKHGKPGYTIIEADSMDAALSMARACPFLEIGGSLEVSELVQMSL